MEEIIFYGRGGMGAITASKILADAAFMSGNYPEVSAIPSFGTERRGAPVQAFCRISDAPIWTRTNIKQANYVIVLDETVFNEGVISRVKPSGTVILNTWKCPADVYKEYPFGDRKVTIITSDLTQIAFDKKLTTTENHPIVNTSVIGLITKTGMKISMNDVKHALEHTFGIGKKTEQNYLAAQVAVDQALVESFPSTLQKELK